MANGKASVTNTIIVIFFVHHNFIFCLINSNVHLPANTASIARQFLRCTLHQLNSNGIFRQIFQSHHSDVILFRSIAISLADFTELNQVTPLKELFEVCIFIFFFGICSFIYILSIVLVR